MIYAEFCNHNKAEIKIIYNLYRIFIYLLYFHLRDNNAEIMNINYKLYHFPLCPFSRKVRVFLKEKSVVVDMATENFWENREEFLSINPNSEIPVLLSYENNKSIVGSSVICEYLEEKYGGVKLIGDDALCRSEVRRLTNWFDGKFFQEVSNYILQEKIVKYYKRESSPNPLYIRAAQINLENHLGYIDFLLSQHKWLAGNKISLADIAAASHISVLDYLGHINWKDNSAIKDWYLLIKSRPSFSNILNDNIVGFKPSAHYVELDF